MNTKTLSFTKFFLFSIVLLNASTSFAESIRLTTTSDKEVIAAYLQGENDSNPVLILHGFLQTKEFSTVDMLATALNDSDYTVLSPTLSLGINNRKQSLSCEAVHTHSLDSDAVELKQWIEWLHKKTGKTVTLIGHSSAGQVLLKYMDSYDAKFIDHAILISVSYFASDSDDNKNNFKKAQVAIKENSNLIDTYSLDYCEVYSTYARNFLSYYSWDRDKTSHVISKFRDQVSIILGTSDKRISGDWRRQVQNINSSTYLIEGANHFFDQAHEFDLIDTVEMLITSD